MNHINQSAPIMKPTRPAILADGRFIAGQQRAMKDLSDEFREFAEEEQKNFRTKYLTKADSVGVHFSLFCGI